MCVRACVCVVNTNYKYLLNDNKRVYYIGMFKYYLLEIKFYCKYRVIGISSYKN